MAFEHLILRAFELGGADVQWPYRAMLHGHVVEQIDGAIHVDGLSCLVEAKDTREAISIEPIAKMRNQLLRRHAGVIGLVFSRSGFTEPALTLAQYLAPQIALLWEGAEIGTLLSRMDFRSALRLKYRKHAETGEVAYNTLIGDIP